VVLANYKNTTSPRDMKKNNEAGGQPLLSQAVFVKLMELDIDRAIWSTIPLTPRIGQAIYHGPAMARVVGAHTRDVEITISSCLCLSWNMYMRVRVGMVISVSVSTCACMSAHTCPQVRPCACMLDCAVICVQEHASHLPRSTPTRLA